VRDGAFVPISSFIPLRDRPGTSRLDADTLGFFICLCLPSCTPTRILHRVNPHLPRTVSLRRLQRAPSRPFSALFAAALFAYVNLHHRCASRRVSPESCDPRCCAVRVMCALRTSTAAADVCLRSHDLRTVLYGRHSTCGARSELRACSRRWFSKAPGSVQPAYTAPAGYTKRQIRQAPSRPWQSVLSIHAACLLIAVLSAQRLALLQGCRAILRRAQSAAKKAQHEGCENHTGLKRRNGQGADGTRTQASLALPLLLFTKPCARTGWKTQWCSFRPLAWAGDISTEIAWARACLMLRGR
jgi:hypothetical protein